MTNYKYTKNTLKTPRKVCFCFLKNCKFFKKQKQTTPSRCRVYNQAISIKVDLIPLSILSGNSLITPHFSFFTYHFSLFFLVFQVF